MREDNSSTCFNIKLRCINIWLTCVDSSNAVDTCINIIIELHKGIAEGTCFNDRS